MTTFVTFGSGQNTVNIDFGAASVLAQVSKSKWRYDSLKCVFLTPNDANVVVRTDMKDFPFSFDGVNGLPVSSVDGKTPTSNSHLYELLSSIVN